MSVRLRLTLVLFLAFAGVASGQPRHVKSSSVPFGAPPRPLPNYNPDPTTPSPLPNSADYSTIDNSGAENTTLSAAVLTQASTFYTKGFTGSRAFVANIEGGLPWLGHETTNWASSGNLYSGTGALPVGSAVTAHATAVTHALVGHGPTDRQRGIAYGVPAANFFAGNVATKMLGGSDFDSNFGSEWTTYYQAMIGGVGGDLTKRADVVNSSWGSSGWFSPNGGNGDFHRYVDGLLVAANDTAGANRGVTVVFSAGNKGSAGDTVFPRVGASYNAISVAALGNRVYSTFNGVPLYHEASDSSSRSPTRTYLPTSSTAYNPTPLDNSRVRVDIAAPGQQLYLASGTATATAYARTDGTSFAAATVSGGVALMADYDRSRFTGAALRNALDARVIKAVLLNGSDKTSGWSNGQTLVTGAGNYSTGAWVTSQALDFNTGAGSMNLDQVYRNLVHNSPAAPSQLTSAGAANSGLAATGWAYGVLDRPVAANAAKNDFVISSSLTKYSEMDVTLSWFVDRSFNTATGASGEVAFHNLNLEVWRTDASGNPVDLVAASRSVYTNTEHVSFLLPENGRYMVRVTRPGGAEGTNWDFGTSTSDPYGLAWMTRASAVYTAGSGNTIAATGTQTNILVAPDAGQTATLTLNGNSTTSVFNRVYVGGTDRGAGGTGTLNVSGGATLNFSNQLRVFSGGRLNIGNGTSTAGTVTGGLLTVDAGGTVAVSGHGSNVVALDRLDVSGTFTAVANNQRVDLFEVNVTGGQFNVTSGSAGYLIQRLSMTGGSVNLSSAGGSTVLAFWNYDPSVTVNPSAGGSVWTSPTTGAAGNRIRNDGFASADNQPASLKITVADGAAAIDLDAGILLSNGGWADARAGYRFLGDGTTRLTNIGNSGNFTVEGGRLRIDHATLAPLGTGTLKLDGGALAYGNTTTNGSTSKAITVGSRGGTVEVTGAARTLTLGGVITYTGGTLTKAGPGTLVLSAVNVGDADSVLSVDAGTLQLGAANAIPSLGTVQLNGGTLSTGAGVSDVMGKLEVTKDSTLNLGAAVHAITFTGLGDDLFGTLTITGWLGVPGASGTAGDILFTSIGLNPNLNHAHFLNTVQFSGYNLGGATFLSLGGGVYELVPAPVPEPAAVLAIAAGALGLGAGLRRLCRALRSAPREHSGNLAA